MGEDVKIILGVVIAIIGVPTAIFGLAKAYIEFKRIISKRTDKNVVDKEISMENSNNSGNVVNASNSTMSNTIDSHNTTYNGNITIQMQTQEASGLNTTSNESIILKERYTSLFAENGSIHSEKIMIKNLGNGKIEGTVYLDDHNTYTLNGTYRNRILTGEFISVGQYTDERGTINLKLISEDVLSGFCSFSKISMTWEDQIRVSPYVWVAGNNTDLINGTYEFCTHCHNEGKKCCCESEEIDMPVILHTEAQKYQSLNPRRQRMRDFSHVIGNTTIRQMNYANSGSKHCHFYSSAENICKIYDVRPTDCRLFPFDIKKNENTGEYWVGYYDEVCDRKLPDKETMKKYAHMLRPQLFLLFPYADAINRDEVCQHLKQTHFEELYKLHSFIF